MDLAELDTRAGAEAGFTLELVHPETGEPVGARITVRGSDGDTYQERMRELQRSRLDSLAANRRAVRQNFDQADNDSLDLLAAATIGWDGIAENGVALAFSDGAARKLYQKYPWIREQVDAAIHKRGNFLTPAAKS